MLNDFDRNAAYRAAIRESAAGRVVYDLGAGVGPMSYYALAAGARRVYGFEIDGAAFAYLRRLRRRFRNFVPLRRDVVRGRLPEAVPEVIVCEMWSAWLTEWPMAKALSRLLARAPGATVIPARGHHVVQLVRARHRAGLPIEIVPGTTASLINETPATMEMSLPALACVTEFAAPLAPVHVTVPLTPLTTGRVNAVRLYSYEEVSPGRILTRLGSRSDEIIRWIPPLDVRRGRQVHLRIEHAWGARIAVRVE